MKKRYGWLLALCGGLVQAGCHGADYKTECLLLHSDFEQYEGWVSPLPVVLSAEQAHSGRYSEHLGPGVVYGPAHQAVLGNCDFMPGRLHLSAWAYLPNGRVRSTNLIVEVNCHGRRPNIWLGLELEQVVKRYQKWEYVQKYIRLPADMDASDEIRVYLWHPESDGDNLWLDDIQLTGER
jgi:hypothetical protein